MTSLRAALLAGLIAAGLASAAHAQAPPEWYTDTGGGGVLARPADEGSGGAVAPVEADGIGDPPAPESQKPPEATPAAAPPRPDAPAPATEPERAERPAATAAQAPEALPAPAASTDPGGSLPFTGLELGAIAAAGLCLLVLGAALRPRRAA